MARLRRPVSKREWDIAFLRTIPALAVASAVGVFFGGPLDNLIVVLWVVPVWLVVRAKAPISQIPA